MQYSKSGIALTESFEGCKLTAYQDTRGRWTIGYGHTGPEVVEGLVWTQARAEAELASDYAESVATVNRVVTISLNQNEFDALVDFDFNDGEGNFEKSTLLKDLNAGNITAAAEQFDRWDYSAGVVVAGLLRRRQAETNEFQGV